jgi:hypothetical protein
MKLKQILMMAGIFWGLISPISAQAAANLTVTPLAWNIIGLDSNNINSGPNHFPIGARVCNTGDAPATNVVASFVWDTTPSPTYIDTCPGTLTTLPPVASLAANTCTDSYFGVEVTRNAAAYNTTRQYHIAVTANGGITESTPTPRELYVEHLISQNRNSVTDMQLSGNGSSFTSIAPGGTISLVVGNTYWIKLVGATATNGYEQIESFIDFPNAVFQVLSVVTTYSADTSSTVDTPYDKLYGDSCVWENDPDSPNYRSCLSTGKLGGNISVTYEVKILSVPSSPLVNPEPLGMLIYDFSGSSYHYNSDFGVSARIAQIVDPSTITISKNFYPNPITPNSVSALTFTITNPYNATINDINFIDIFPISPGAMTIASPLTTSNTCGGTLQDSGGSSLAAADVGIKLINGILPANGACSITVNVTVPSATGMYSNDTNHLYIGTADTGNHASGTLTVGTAPAAPAAACGVTMAFWDIESSTVSNNNPAIPPTATLVPGNVSSATASFVNSSGGSNTIQMGANNRGNSSKVWRSDDHTQGTLNPPGSATPPYYEFTVNYDSGVWSNVAIKYDNYANANWNQNNFSYVWSSADGGAYASTSPASGVLTRSQWTTIGPFTAASTGSTSTTFRINADGATNPNGYLDLDNIIITGCLVLQPPTITKSFSPDPVAVGATSTLTFTITNPNTERGATLKGIAFSDYLPNVDIQGTVAVTNGSTAVTGTGTKFKTQLVPGSIVFLSDFLVNLTGTVAATQGSAIVTGTGTAFTTELSVGDIISINSVYYTVAAIASDTSLTLTRTYRDATASGLTAKYCRESTVSSITDDTHLTLSAAYSGSTASGLQINTGLTLTAPPTTTCGSVVTGASGEPAISLSRNSLQGTVAVTNGSAAVTGTGTAFTTQLSAGRGVLINLVEYTVLSITDNTHMTLSVNYAGTSASGLSMFTGALLQGTVNVTNGSATVTGNGTNFTGELAAGRLISINSVDYTVLSIASDTSLTLTTTYAGITLSGLTATSGLAPGGSCTVTATVKTNAAGVFTNISDNILSTEAGTNTTSTGYATANLTAVLAPVIAKQFAPNPVRIGAVSTLTFTITNPNQNDSISGVAFSDAFPTSPGNMTVASPTGVSASGCGSPTFAPVAGTGSISFSGGTIAAGGTCTVKVNVTAPITGSYSNTSGNVSHIINSATVNGNTASDIMKVNAVNPAISIMKQVGASAAGPWYNTLAIATASNVYYKFTVENIGDVAFTAFNVTDPTLDPISCTWTTTNSPSTLPNLPAGTATVDPSATCVVGPVTAILGSHTNTATAHGTYNSTQYNSNPDTATYKTGALTLVKSVTETCYTAAGNILHYSYVVTNTGASALYRPVTVADDKSTNETCSAVSTAGNHDNYLDPGESVTCAATYTVTTGDVTAGFVANKASATVEGVTSNEDTKTIYISGTIVGDGTRPSDKNVNQSAVNATVSAFTLSTSCGSDTVTGLVITGTNPADVASNGVKLWIDNNGNAEWDAGDTQIGTGVSFSGSTATFTGLTLSATTASSSVNYIITYDISASAIINDTLTAVVTGVTATNTVTNNDTTDATLTIGGAPTAVKLISFDATEYQGAVLLQWRTGYEVKNLGFNIYREGGGRLERVNSQIIAGSALIAGPNIAISAGRPYAWWDESSAGRSDYYLEDIDLSGKRTLYGPVTAVAAKSQPTPVFEQSATLNGLSGMHTGKSDPTSKLKPRLSIASAMGLVSANVNAAQPPEQVQWSLAGAPAVKIFIQEEGWYRITQPDLIAYGLDDVDPRYLQLYVNGRQIPMVVTGGDGKHLDPQDYIEFYGMGLDTPSTDAQTYWLVVGKSKGLRVKTASGGAKVAESSNFAFTVSARPRALYAPAMPKNTEGDRFYGPLVSSEQALVMLNVQNADGAAVSKGLLDVTLQGIFDGEHHVDVILNGNNIGQVVFSNMDRGHAALQFNQQGLLHDGDNTLQLIGRGGDMDFSLIDVVRLTYWHTYTADNDALRFTAYGGGKITVRGFSTSGIRVMDITDPNTAWEVSPKVAPQGSAYAATFSVPFKGPRTLLAFNDNRILHPAAITVNKASALHSKENSADMVIIAHSSLMSALNPLKQFRESQGHSVAIIDVEDIYDEFSFGNNTPEAIQNFLRRAYTYWAGKPRFLLLTGDATVDPRDYLGYGLPDLVPTNLVDGVYSEAASDDLFADFNGDGLPEMAVGRIPAGTALEVTTVVSKIIGYEQAVSAPWMKTAVVVSDRGSSDDFDFEGGSDEIEAMIAPYMTSIKKVYRRDYESDAQATQDLLNSINQGVLLAIYMGHGTEEAWGGNILISSNADNLTNGLALPFFINMTCWNGWFPNPFNITISEALLKAGNGGAVAVWASSGLTGPDPQRVMNKEMVSILFNGTQPTLGESAAQAKAATSDMDARGTWILFGDPLTRLKQ